MRNSEYFRGKKVLVLGLARSGLACAELLKSSGARVSVSDREDSVSKRLLAAALKLEERELQLGRHTKDFMRGNDLVVVSPGIAAQAEPLVWARDLKLTVVSEIEVGWFLCPATVIAVTGSSGKTTVTTLIGRVLEEAGKKVFVCGNIGEAFCAKVALMSEGDFVALEVSSFQLEGVRDFKPKIAVILNLNPNHLDRHQDLEEYLLAKKRIFRKQDKNDYLVLNRLDTHLQGLSQEAGSNVVYFQGSPQLNPNQAAVLAVAGILGVDKNLCLKVFSEFKGLQHRLEYVTEINKVKFINDSKATLIESTVWALDNIAAPVILIAGGRDKGLDYAGILKAGRKKVKEAILIGEAREKIARAIDGRIYLKQVDTLQEAVEIAFQDASAGDYVLLSPMCSSFDMFRDYEHRGRVFKEAVFALAKREALRR
jgi:UDP-N-acetylmuramoylalanine--D-glutamate ligase